MLKNTIRLTFLQIQAKTESTLNKKLPLMKNQLKVISYFLHNQTGLKQEPLP